MTLELFHGNIWSFWGIFTKFGHIFITHGESICTHHFKDNILSDCTQETFLCVIKA